MLKKILYLFVALAAGGALLFALPYFRGEKSTVTDLERIYTDEKLWREDTYGGETPEETLRLFIEALKAEDIDLAAKYFVLDKQAKWKNKLLIIKEKGLLGAMVADLEKLKKTREETEETFYTLTNEENIVSIQLILSKNPTNGKWKITEL